MEYPNISNIFYDNHYTISQQGEVYSYYKNKILPPHDNNGYKMVMLKLNNKQKWHYIHRLVAQHFIPNPEHKTWVNHKDGNRSNNDISNLEWSTPKENIQHSYDCLGRKAPQGFNHCMKGKHPSNETRKKQSESKIGEKHPKFKGWYITPFGKFASIRECAEAENTYQMKIIRYYKNNQPGYYFFPK